MPTRKLASIAAATAVSSVILLASPLVTASPAAMAPPASTCSECCLDENVCAALAELAGLHAAVDELVPDAGLASSLDAKVDAATSSVLAERPTTALNQLDALDNELTAADQAGKVSTTTSSLLKARADASKNAINNMR